MSRFSQRQFRTTSSVLGSFLAGDAIGATMASGALIVTLSQGACAPGLHSPNSAAIVAAQRPNG